jgi:hypothetical protein
MRRLAGFGIGQLAGFETGIRPHNDFLDIFNKNYIYSAQKCANL